MGAEPVIMYVQRSRPTDVFTWHGRSEKERQQRPQPESKIRCAGARAGRVRKGGRIRRCLPTPSSPWRRQACPRGRGARSPWCGVGAASRRALGGRGPGRCHPSPRHLKPRAGTRRSIRPSRVQGRHVLDPMVANHGRDGMDRPPCDTRYKVLPRTPASGWKAERRLQEGGEVLPEIILS
eukprot:scaffold301221_cov28-Tisochrysis_lutea.AAC.2